VRAWRTGATPALVVVLLGCFVSCGPSQTVDRARLDTDALPLRDLGPDPDPDPDGSVDSDGGVPLDASDDAAPPDPDAPTPMDAAPDTPPVDAASPDAPFAPDVSPDTAPPLPLVAVSHAPGVASTNLTALGTFDWRHWGYNSYATVNRKRNGPNVISMVPIGTTNVARYNDRPVQFAWDDGYPTLDVNSTPDGIVVGDQTGRGFEIRVTGDPGRARTIKAHLGVWGARARLTVSLSGQAGTLYTDDTLTASNPGADRTYTIEFQPAVQTQALVLRWTVDSLSLRYGNVTLQAVSVAQ
jgi:hypothetical protein